VPLFYYVAGILERVPKRQELGDTLPSHTRAGMGDGDGELAIADEKRIIIIYNSLDIHPMNLVYTALQIITSGQRKDHHAKRISDR
jgi:hypothetical protein